MAQKWFWNTETEYYDEKITREINGKERAINTNGEYIYKTYVEKDGERLPLPKAPQYLRKLITAVADMDICSLYQMIGKEINQTAKNRKSLYGRRTNEVPVELIDLLRLLPNEFTAEDITTVSKVKIGTARNKITEMRKFNLVTDSVKKRHVKKN